MIRRKPCQAAPDFQQGLRGPERKLLLTAMFRSALRNAASLGEVVISHTALGEAGLGKPTNGPPE